MDGRWFDRDGLIRILDRWCLPVVVACVAMFLVVGQVWPGPSGIHFIRQTDSLAFLVHYREYGADLLKPGVLDLRNAPDQGAAASEFPLFYWTLALLEHLFGPMPDSIRWLNLGLIVLAVVWCIRVMTRLLDERLPAYATVLIFVGSPVLAYYAFNFLPDAGVFALVMMGWSLVMPDIVANRPKFRVLPLLLFTLAGAIKAPAAMHLLAWSVLLFFQWIRTRELLSAGRTFALLLGILIVTTWHLYVRAYDAAHDTSYFLTWSEPLWDMSPVERLDTWRLMTEYWWTKYLHPSAWHLFGMFLIILAIRWRHMNRFEWATMFLLWASAAAFVVLFFRKFADHDYYFLTLLPVIIWTMMFGCKVLIQWVKTKWVRGGVYLILAALAIACLLHARLETQRRTTGPATNHARVAPYLKEIRVSVSAIQLPKDARVLVLGDSSANGALTAVARMGWAFPGYPAKPQPPWGEMVDMGATHLLVIDQETPRTLSHRPLVGGNRWSLWEIIR